MDECRYAFLRISDISSIIDDESGRVVVHLSDGREFSVVATGAVECWQNILDIVDPQGDDGQLPAERDPFVQLRLT